MLKSLLKPVALYCSCAALIGLAGCAQPDGEDAQPDTRQPDSAQASIAEEIGAPPQADRPQEAVSFGGKPLLRFDINAERLSEIAENARPLEEKDVLSEDEYIQLGGYYIQAGRFQDAIALYTKGLEAFPESFKLRRHRGHRYINVRDLDSAIVDLLEAVDLMGDNPAEVFQVGADGEPNGTYEHWVWYHIGLYHYLNGDYGDAATAYEKCVETATKNDHLIGSTDWLYNSRVKNGEPEKAAAAIAAIAPDIDANTERSYYKRVMLYKGLLAPEDIIDISKPGSEWTGGDITTGYGVANWYKEQGETEIAQEIYDKILETPWWSAWA